MGAGDTAAWNRTVFTSERGEVSIAGVIAAAHFRGEIEPLWREVHALAQREDRDVDDAALQAMSEQFRSERDLISAEETERWLEARGLTLEDFSDYFRRRFWKDATGEKVEPEAFDSSAEHRDLLRVELLLSGEFDRMAVRLAWRVAAGGECAPDAVESERGRFLERAGFDDEWLARLGRDQSWLDEMLKLEAAYRRQCDALLTPEARERMLNALRLPLKRVELETVDLESRDAAREAFFCVREDGVAMAEVAKNGRYPYRRDEIVLEDLPAELRQKILCAASGEMLEPIARGDGFQLCRIIRKIEPDLADAQTRSRVEQRIVEDHFSELAAGCVRWMIPPSSTYDRGPR